MKKAKRKHSPRTANSVDKYIGAQMRERRQAIGLSQEALAGKLGVSFQQVQKYETGANRVSAARLFDICEVLEVSLASMFERQLKA
jgi:transcriptional regulator with XRE-family HTH domain